MLYGTSAQFLEQFGLKNLGDLPTLREINELINAPEGEAVAGATVGPDQPVEDSLLAPVDLEQSVGQEPSPAAGDIERVLEEGPALSAIGPDRPGEESASTIVGPDQSAEVESAPATEPAGSASDGGPATETEPGKASASRPA